MSKPWKIGLVITSIVIGLFFGLGFFIINGVILAYAVAAFAPIIIVLVVIHLGYKLYTGASPASIKKHLAILAGTLLIALFMLATN